MSRKTLSWIASCFVCVTVCQWCSTCRGFVCGSVVSASCVLLGGLMWCIVSLKEG